MPTLQHAYPAHRPAWASGLSLLALSASLIGCGEPAITEGLTPPVQNPPVTAPAVLRPVSGDGQAAPTGSQLPAPLVVRVYDSVGNPYPNIPVDWTLSQAGTLGQAQTVTDATGTARNTWQLGTAPGDQFAIATAQSLTPVRFVGRALLVFQSITISPDPVTIQTGGSQQFSTTGVFTDGSIGVPNVTYSATGGVITSQGLFLAGQRSGTFQVIARLVGGTLADTATVSIIAPGTVLTQLTITPRFPSVPSGQSLQFSVTGLMSDGSTIVPPVSYTATGGPITAGGLYTAGSTLGRFQVVATSLDQVVGSVADTALVTITAAPPGGDLVNMTFETGAFEGLTDGSGGAPVNGEIVSGGCFRGIYCFDVNMVGAGADQEGLGYWVGTTPYQDLWISFALKVISAPSAGVATQELLIFRDGAARFGELDEVGGEWVWNWQLTDPARGNLVVTALGSVNSVVGQWHTYKIHLQSHGTTSVTIGRDGVDNVALLSTPAAAAGIPTTLTLGGTLVGGSGPSHFQVDNVHIGTVDPGWP
jgi:hypothetical protein